MAFLELTCPCGASLLLKNVSKKRRRLAQTRWLGFHQPHELYRLQSDHQLAEAVGMIASLYEDSLASTTGPAKKPLPSSIARLLVPTGSQVEIHEPSLQVDILDYFRSRPELLGPMELTLTDSQTLRLTSTLLTGSMSLTDDDSAGSGPAPSPVGEGEGLADRLTKAASPGGDLSLGTVLDILGLEKTDNAEST